MLTSVLPSREFTMTAVASPLAAPLAGPLQQEPVPLAHRLLHMRLTPLRAPSYSPEALVSAIAEFCRARSGSGVPSAQVLAECMALAACRLDGAGRRLVEVLARQSIACPLGEEFGRRA
jgi:hypothetical protein